MPICFHSFFSKLSTVVSGVPQGTVLAPLLFVLYINDVVDIIDKPSICELFADDVKLYCDFEFADDFTPGDHVNNHLASTLLKLEGWSQVWQLRVNVSKCSVLHLGLHNPLFTYTLNAKPLPMADCVLDLEASQMVNLIYRTFLSKITDLLGRAFKTYVRSILEYCTRVWSPYLLHDVNKVDSVQRYFTHRLFPGQQLTLESLTWNASQ